MILAQAASFCVSAACAIFRAVSISGAVTSAVMHGAAGIMQKLQHGARSGDKPFVRLSRDLSREFAMKTRAHFSIGPNLLRHLALGQPFVFDRGAGANESSHHFVVSVMVGPRPLLEPAIKRPTERRSVEVFVDHIQRRIPPQ